MDFFWPFPVITFGCTREEIYKKLSTILISWINLLNLSLENISETVKKKFIFLSCHIMLKPNALNFHELYVYWNGKVATVVRVVCFPLLFFLVCWPWSAWLRKALIEFPLLTLCTSHQEQNSCCLLVASIFTSLYY